MSTWILVAESSHGILFTKDAQSSELKKLEQFEHPEGKLRSKDLGTDQPGRLKSGVAAGKHGLSEEVSPHESEQRKFIHFLVDYLDQHFEQRDFHELMIVAPPKFLGELRKALPPKLTSAVVQELTKNYPSFLGEKQILGHLVEDLGLHEMISSNQSPLFPKE